MHLLTLAVFGLFIVSCSSEEESSRQDSAQSSDQKQAVKQEAPDQAEEVQQHIKAAVDQIISSKELKIGNTWLAEVSVIPVFYERRQYRPAWTQAAKIKDLMQAIEKIKEDGLLPDDYHRRQLQALSVKIDTQ